MTLQFDEVTVQIIYSVDNDDDDDDDCDEGEYDDNDDNPFVGIDGNSVRDWFIVLCKGISDSLDSGFHVEDSGFQVLDSSIFL